MSTEKYDRQILHITGNNLFERLLQISHTNHTFFPVCHIHTVASQPFKHGLVACTHTRHVSKKLSFETNEQYTTTGMPLSNKTLQIYCNYRKEVQTRINKWFARQKFPYWLDFLRMLTARVCGNKFLNIHFGSFQLVLCRSWMERIKLYSWYLTGHYYQRTC